MNFLDFEGLAYYTEQINQTIDYKINEYKPLIASRVILHSESGDVIELELNGQYNLTVGDSSSSSVASTAEEIPAEITEESTEPEIVE